MLPVQAVRREGQTRKQAVAARTEGVAEASKSTTERRVIRNKRRQKRRGGWGSDGREVNNAKTAFRAIEERRHDMYGLAPIQPD